MVSLDEISYRPFLNQDVNIVARLRAANAGSVDHWKERITAYNSGTHHPQMALPTRIIYVALYHKQVVGFIAGHLTRRFQCDGELQWIDTDSNFRRIGIASLLVRQLASWFIHENARRICVDPGNDIARHFYLKNGAVPLNEHWMYWKNISAIL